MQTPLEIEIKIEDPKILALGAIAVTAAVGYATFLRLPSTPYKKLKIHPGLKDLEGSETAAQARLKELYPEDIFPEPKYAPLQYGRIKYHRFGYEYGHKVVLICGISIPCIIWAKVMPILQKHFNVLVFDHYGRGYSDAPEVTYNADFYATEVAQLMQYVGWEKAKIVGMSMGGGVAVAFAKAFPHLVDEKVTLVAPGGIMQAGDIPLLGKVLTSPTMQSVIGTNLARSVMAKLYNPASQSNIGEELQKLQRIVLPGHMMALCSSARDGPIRGLEDEYSVLGKSGFKIGLIWGTRDSVVPYRLATEVLKRIPEAQFISVPGAGHDLLVSHAELVGDALYRFLK